MREHERLQRHEVCVTLEGFATAAQAEAFEKALRALDGWLWSKEPETGISDEGHWMRIFYLPDGILMDQAYREMEAQETERSRW